MPDTRLAYPAPTSDSALRLSLATRFQKVRRRTTELVAPLSPEDLMIQSVEDGAPAKWHLAHTTWQFETTVLVPHSPGYRPFDPAFLELFTSRRDARGSTPTLPILRLLSRPDAAEVMRYRDHVNAAVLHLINAIDEARLDEVAACIEVGIIHERRHQERLLTHLKHAFWCNPLRPAYEPKAPPPPSPQQPQSWVEHPGGMVEVGHPDPSPGADHDGPRHRVYLAPFRLAARPVSCGEYLAFIEDGGYASRSLWLADGWEAAQAEGWRAPLYWERRGGEWQIFTLHGMRPLDPGEPVCHVSWYEADAFARWSGQRLPFEAEWEVVAACDEVRGGNLLGNGHRQPRPGLGHGDAPWQMFGDVWEWTRDSFTPYPGHCPAGIDNGRFTANHMVLRGGSCVTPFSFATPYCRHHLRPTDRISFTGVRLAENL